jgi:hypothetical protein
MSSSDDDDDTDDEELLLDFQKLINKHLKLQKMHGDLLCSHEKLIESYALLKATHEVMVKTVKFFQLHNHIPFIYLMLTLVALKQSHHMMIMYS